MGLKNVFVLITPKPKFGIGAGSFIGLTSGYNKTIDNLASFCHH
jgi:hypothetical protein